MLLEDSRQQANRHSAKHNYFLKNGIAWTREKLTCGDYQLVGNPNVAVDTKKDMQEVIGDIQAKTLSKENIKNALVNLLGDKYNSYKAELCEIITGDDSGRDVAYELTQYVYKNRLPEAIISRLQDLYTNYHGFFHRGLVRAQIRGVKLFILVASDAEYIGWSGSKFWQHPIKTLADVAKWKNPRRYIVKGYTPRDVNGNRKPISKYPRAMEGETLYRALKTMESKYGCKFVFCSNKDMGKTIIELLTGKKL